MNIDSKTDSKTDRKIDRKIDTRDRLAGCLIGLIVGDALGVPFEFYFQRSNVYTGLLYIKPNFHFRSGTRIDVVGQWSDDTECSLCIARSLIKNNGKYNKDDMIQSYMNWANGSKAMGKNTRALFKGVTTIKGYQKRWDNIFKDTPEDTWTQSNGSLMRCSLLAFCNENDIVEDCRLTNPHKINIDTNIIYCLLIKFSVTELTSNNNSNSDNKFELEQKLKQKAILDLILESEDFHDDVKNTIRTAIEEIIPTRDLTFTIKNDNNTKSKEKIKTKGWVLHGIYCAVWAWYHSKNYQDAIDVIIRLGGDTDTNAAIAGALLGARFGYKHLFSEERTKYNIKMVRNVDTKLGGNPRPKEYCIDDFDDIIDGLHKFYF